MTGSQEPNITKAAVQPGSFYYNAPQHLVLTSPYFSSAPLHTYNGPDDGDDEERLRKREEQLKIWSDAREVKRRIREVESAKRREINAEYRRLASIAAKAKFIAEGGAKPKVPRSPKREVMLDTRPKRENTGWIKAFPPAPIKKKHSREQREKETIRERDRRAALRREKISSLPECYVRAETIAVTSSQNAVVVALRTGLVPGVKVGIKWYCNADELRSYCLEVEQKRLAGLAASRAKILEMRRAKANDKRNVSTTKGDSV